MDRDDPTGGVTPAGELPQELVEAFLRLCRGDFAARLPRTHARDERDVLAFLFNTLAEEVGEMVAASRDQEKRLNGAIEEVTTALVKVASGDFSAQVSRDFKGDALDVLGFLVNSTITELGTLAEASRRKAEEDRRRLEALVAERTRELQLLAATDDLTGAHNRRRILEVAEEERGRAERYGRPLCVVLLDLDHFKAVNDSFGHHAGDEVLRRAADVMQTGLRESDRFGRYGGEEFLIVAPETALPHAVVLAERIRHVFENSVHPGGSESVRMTLSAGVAEWRERESLDALLRRADVALYQAKQRGRNLVAPAI